MLVHEGGFPNEDIAYSRSFHTNAEELAKIASDAKPKLLILYHQRNDNEEGLRIIRARYPGSVVVANDLDIFE